MLNNLTKEQGETAKGFFGTLIDVIVAVTGGKDNLSGNKDKK